MPKQLKKIKVKKPRKPRQPRRQGIPKKPHVTNISVNISGGSNQPSGSYYFPNASQQVQPLVSNMFTPTMPSQNFEHNDSGTQTDMPSRVSRGMQSEPVYIMPNELNQNVTLRTRRNIAAGGGSLLANPVDVPIDTIPPPLLLPRTPIVHRQQETPSPSTPVIRVVNPRRIDTPAPRARAAGGGAGSRGGLTTLNKQQIHDLARSYNISTEGRNMTTLQNMISQQRKKG